MGLIDTVAHYAFSGMQRKIAEQRKEINRLRNLNDSLSRIARGQQMEIEDMANGKYASDWVSFAEQAPICNSLAHPGWGGVIFIRGEYGPGAGYFDDYDGLSYYSRREGVNKLVTVPASKYEMCFWLRCPQPPYEE